MEGNLIVWVLDGVRRVPIFVTLTAYKYRNLDSLAAQYWLPTWTFGYRQ